ncbi:MAG: DEAD/DEAH box helicase, partial [Vicinamibacterales bacterium]
MSLAHLGPLFSSIPVPMQHQPGAKRVVSTGDFRTSERAVALAAASRVRSPLLIVTARQESADALYSALSTLLPPTAQPYIWSAADPLPYEQLPHDPALSASRATILGRLTDASPETPLVNVTTIRALMTCIRKPASFARDVVNLQIGQRHDDARLLRQLVAAGYQVEPLVEGPGTISRRGGILDIYTPGSSDAIRLEFFGDEIDSIRRFDPVTQRSVERIESATVLPPIEFDLSGREAAFQTLRERPLDTLRDEVRDEWERMLAHLAVGDIPPSIDLVATAFPDNDATLLDYLPEQTLIARVEPEAQALQASQIALQAEGVRETLEQAGEIPFGFERPYATIIQLEARFAGRDGWMVGAGDDAPGVHDLPSGDAFVDVPIFGGQIDDLVVYIRERTEQDWRVVLASDQSERLRDLLEERDIYPRVLKRGGSMTGPPPLGSVDVVHAPLSAGFAIGDARLVVLSDLEVFGLRKTVRPSAPQQRRRAAPIRQFVPGAYVVHVEHGVGEFKGLVTLDLSGAEREYLQVEYAAGDRLYVPVDQADRLMPYESPAGTPKITRLSSPEWARVKSRVRQAVREMAFELIQIYAAREVAAGHEFPIDSSWDLELAESFPFRETLDQQKAIDDVKHDMETARPMDRLVCGDVGYGKTEVALRASFKAVNDGMQVVVLVPTTILALQHYNSFRERLAAFPVSVEMLSRLRTKQEQERITEGLKSGAIDIVVGTHRLLQKDVNFHNLGLLIVDEEQRFGVRHKEHIKRVRSEIDVLTMTATPIPRTLHMALTGVRDLSLITTPPQDRVPIRTFVTPTSDAIVRESILREVARGGQVYVVHNRVQSIYRL